MALGVHSVSRISGYTIELSGVAVMADQHILQFLYTKMRKSYWLKHVTWYIPHGLQQNLHVILTHFLPKYQKISSQNFNHVNNGLLIDDAIHNTWWHLKRFVWKRLEYLHSDGQFSMASRQHKTAKISLVNNGQVTSLLVMKFRITCFSWRFACIYVCMSTLLFCWNSYGTNLNWFCREMVKLDFLDDRRLYSHPNSSPAYQRVIAHARRSDFVYHPCQC